MPPFFVSARPDRSAQDDLLTCRLEVPRIDERSTYDEDFYGWSQQQAGVLRRLADRSNNEIDPAGPLQVLLARCGHAP